MFKSVWRFLSENLTMSESKSSIHSMYTKWCTLVKWYQEFFFNLKFYSVWQKHIPKVYILCVCKLSYIKNRWNVNWRIFYYCHPSTWSIFFSFIYIIALQSSREQQTSNPCISLIAVICQTSANLVFLRPDFL